MTSGNELTYVCGKTSYNGPRRVFSRESELRYTWGIMKRKLFNWLGREFVEIIGEGKTGAPPDSSANELFRKFEAELKAHGLSLDNTARIRMWGRDKDARTLATAARSKILTGNRKAASSSFISREWFDSDATAGLELLAMRPINPGAERRPVDFEPARNYLCYLRYDSVLFYSGFTSDAATLEEQVPDVLRTLANASRCQAQAGVKSSSSRFCWIEPRNLKRCGIFSPKAPK